MRSQTKRSMAQNALLINECNKLRKENKLTKIMLQEMQERNKILERQKRKWTSTSTSLSKKGVVSCPPVNGKSSPHANEEKKQLTPFQRRKIESSRRGRGKIVTGTTQGMYKESQTDTKLRTMENNLTETHREMEIQRLEIRRLRNQVSALLHEMSNEQKARFMK